MKRLISLTLTICLLMSSSSCAKSGSESTKAMSEMETVNTTTESAIESTVISSETKKQASKPVVEKAVGEYDSYKGCNVYKPENVDIIPGIDYRDYTYKDLNEIKQHIDGDYPGGFLKIEDWLTELGIDASDIDTSGNDNFAIRSDDGIISIAVAGTGVSYLVNGQSVCEFESGKATTRNNRVYLFEETSVKKFSNIATVPAESLDVLEVFVNAYVSGSTTDPLANNA